MNFTKDELDTIRTAIRFIHSNMDSDLFTELCDEEMNWSESELFQLERKIESQFENGVLNNCSSEASLHVIMENEIKDWRLSEGHTPSELNERHLDSYILRLEKHSVTNQVWFSVFNKKFLPFEHDHAVNGLFGLIEIRNGAPALSLGVESDENLIQVLTNAGNEISVINNYDSPDMKEEWKSIEYSSPTSFGYCYSSSSPETLKMARETLLDLELSNNNIVPKNSILDEKWFDNGDQWTKNVYKNAHPGSTPVSTINVQFVNNSTFIESIWVDENIQGK